MGEIISGSRWAGRFIWASIIQGLLAVALTAVVVLPVLTPSVSRVIAAGSAGTWFFVGYTMYLVVGVIGVAVTALFYHYLESILKRSYSGIGRIFAWLHLILMNVGIIGTTWLLMLAGYLGGAALLPEASGGGGMSPGQVHVEILGTFPEPIAVAIGILAIGVLMGGLGYVWAYSRQPRG